MIQVLKKKIFFHYNIFIQPSTIVKGYKKGEIRIERYKKGCKKDKKGIKSINQKALKDTFSFLKQNKNYQIMLSLWTLFIFNFYPPSHFFFFKKPQPVQNFHKWNFLCLSESAENIFFLFNKLFLK